MHFEPVEVKKDLGDGRGKIVIDTILVPRFDSVEEFVSLVVEQATDEMKALAKRYKLDASNGEASAKAIATRCLNKTIGTDASNKRRADEVPAQDAEAFATKTLRDFKAGRATAEDLQAAMAALVEANAKAMAEQAAGNATADAAE